MDASLSYVRQFAPKVLAAVGFAAGVEAVEPLVKAAAILAELYATGARKVPEGAPADFVPTKWRGYLDAAPNRLPPLLGAVRPPGPARRPPLR